VSFLRTQHCGRSLRASLWLLPAACMCAALLLIPAVRWVDERTHWTLLRVGPEGARQILAALAASLLTFLVFGLSLLLLAVQMVSGQLTPRLIARVFEARLTKITVGLFVFAWVYALGALAWVGEGYPQLTVALAVALSLGCVIVFLYRVQTAVHRMRPGTILLEIGGQTRAVVERLYPLPYLERGAAEPARSSADALGAWQNTHTVVHVGAQGVIVAWDHAALGDLAANMDCSIEVVPAIGDLVAPGATLFRLYGAGANSTEDRALRQCLLLGPERALERDAAFGIRIIVDVAIRALSPGINDPTTAVLAVDQLHHLLLLLGERQLDDAVVRDARGTVRVFYRAPAWSDYLQLATTEIVLYGGSSPQVTRRLAAMLEDLRSRLPAARAAALGAPQAFLECRVVEAFAAAEQRAQALQADSQGFGSPRTFP
jgi:uncharacterized membrane protein